MKGRLWILVIGVILLERISAQERASKSTGERRNRQSPRKIDLAKYRKDVDTGKHIRLGTTTKCPDNMRFFAVDGNDTSGMCDCDYYQCSRPSIYSPETKKCYFAWSQGPCKSDEWFAYDGHLKPVCEKRGCDQGLEDEPITSENVSLSYWFRSPHDGGCYESGSEGYCTNDDETLLIAPGEPIPICRNTALCVPLGSPEPQLCLPGNRRSHLGLCASAK